MADGRDALLAANPATARNCSEPHHDARFQLHTRARLYDNDIFAVPGGRRTRKSVDRIAPSDNSFRDEKSGGEFFVVPGRAHGCRQNPSANSNFERLLDGEIVRLILQRTIGLSPNNPFRSNPDLFHVKRIYRDVIIASVEVCHLYISPAHNFVGHHGREPDEFPAIEVPLIECVAGRGIRGDRYFDFKDDYKGQITFFSLEVFDELGGALQVEACSPATVRRNVVTRDVDLNELIGQDFEIQGIRFHGTQECLPCYWMDRAVGVGAEEFLKGRGGLRARILTNGQLRSNARIPDVVR